MQFISFLELYLFLMYFGSLTYLLGTLILIFFTWKVKMKRYKRILLFVLQMIVSIIITPFMLPLSDIEEFGFILLPAFIAEVITIPIFYFILKKLHKTTLNNQQSAATQSTCKSFGQNKKQCQLLQLLPSIVTVRATYTTAKSRNPSPMQVTSTTAPECTIPIQVAGSTLTLWLRSTTR